MRVRPLMTLLVLAAPLGVSLTGCAGDVGPTAAELKARWEAQNIYPAEYKRDLLAFMRTYLNDPSRVRGASASKPDLKSVGQGERFVVCVRYRERKYGGALGPPRYGAATFVSAKLYRYFETAPEVKVLCTDAKFEPFPEMETITR